MAQTLKAAVLDTNILDYSLKAHQSESTAELLNSLKVKYELAVSEYTRFEIYRHLEVTKIPLAKTLLQTFTHLNIDRRTMHIAACLFTLYRVDKATCKFIDRYGDGDVIIGSTCIQNGTYLVTADLNDFPRPFFTEVETYEIVSTKKRVKPIIVKVLQPEIGHFNKMVGVVYGKQE